MNSQKLEYFPYTCPNCAAVRNAVDVAKELPPEVLVRRTRSLIGRLRRKHLAGPGRPNLARCPGCSQEMSADDLRKHRISCVRGELKKLIGNPFELDPKDPDPYPNFYIHNLADYANEVEFNKGSNQDVVTVDLHKIAEITIKKGDKGEKVVHIRLLGRVVWLDDIKRWRFAPTLIGRPPTRQS